MLKKTIFKLIIAFLMALAIVQSLTVSEVKAATGYIAITKTQTLDITYNVMQIQSGISITQVRVGNDVINEVEG